MSVKLLSVNIEGNKHLDTVEDFLMREKADVVCLMEVFEDALPKLIEGYPYVEFAPSLILDQDEEIKEGKRIWGEVIMSKYLLTNVRREYCGEWSATNLPRCPLENHVPALILADVEIEGKVYRIGTIHFTWTPMASVTEKQRKHAKQLLKWVSEEGELVLAGDFNIPRGNEMYQELVKTMKDNIPSEVESTIDPVLHYANKGQRGRLKLVVDYVWSTPNYKISGVRVVSGVSDHCGLVCEVSKTDAD